MIQETIIDNEYATLWYYPEQRVIQHVFKKFIYGAEFRNVLETGLRIFQERGANKWLSDDRKNSALPTADLEFGVHDWSPRVVKAGWTHWALVMPDKQVGKMNMERHIAAYAEQGVVVEVFESPEEAFKWLESV